jgi:hypothetical protein
VDALLQQHAQESNVVWVPGRLRFDLSKNDATVFEAVANNSNRFRSVFASIQSQIPLQPTSRPYTDWHFYRLPNHNRSFCYSLSETESIFDAPAFVFKGTEPLLQDFPLLLDWMSQAPFRRSTRVMADHFPLSEGKIPGALSMKEACREAEIALEVQRRHLNHYGELARIPTPLAIHVVDEPKAERAIAMLRNKLSSAAFARVEAILQSELAIYIYYYPIAPIRSNYRGGIAYTKLTEHVTRTFNKEVTVADWARLMTRLVYLGFLPYNVRNEGLGACMDFGNATLDGGFCDLDSIIPVEESPDDEFYYESIVQSFAILQNTIKLTLGISADSSLYPSIDEFACGQFVRQLVNSAILTEKRPALGLDERFQRIMTPHSIADVSLITKRKKRIRFIRAFQQHYRHLGNAAWAVPHDPRHRDRLPRTEAE